MRSRASLAIGEPVAAWTSKNLRWTCAQQPASVIRLPANNWLKPARGSGLRPARRHVSMAPVMQGFLAVVHRRPLAVLCPAWRSRRPQALMGSVDRGLIRLAGSHCPMSSDRYLSIRGRPVLGLDPGMPSRVFTLATLPLPSAPPAFRPLPAWSESPPAASSPPRQCAPSPACAGAGFVGKRTGDDHALLRGQQFDQPGMALGSLAAQHRHCAPSGQARGRLLTSRRRR